MAGYISREITLRLARALRQLPVVVLSGLRQSGKRTLLQSEPTLRGHTSRTLDDFATLAGDAKLNAVTAGRYPDLLDASFLIRRLPPFLKSRSSRLAKSPKPHFADSGLAAHLAGVTALDPGRDASPRGALFEIFSAPAHASLSGVESVQDRGSDDCLCLLY